jgi:RHS repeat-associated protein
MYQTRTSRVSRETVALRRRNRNRPVIEFLEIRQLLANVDWTSSTSGSWDVASNWSTGKVPGPTDDVFINVSNAIPTVTISSVVESVHSITATDALVISGGGLTIAASSAIDGSFTLSGGTLTTNVPLTLAGSTEWTGGSIAGSGTVTNTGTIAISTNSSLQLGPALNDSGTINQAGTGSLVVNSKTLTIAQGHSFNLQSDASITTTGNGALTIQGVLARTDGTGNSTVSGSLDLESGTLDVETGTVILNGSVTSTGGQVSVSQGATLDLTGGQNVIYTGDLTGAGNGTISLNAGELIVGSTGATLDFAPGLMQWSGGAINLDESTLTNLGDITVTTTQVFGLDANGFYNGSGGGDLPGTLANEGSIELTGTASLSLYDSVLLDNRSSGLLEFDDDCGIALGNDTPSCTNEGTIEKAAGGGTSAITTPFSNQGGVIEVNTGTISLAGDGGTSTGGTFTVAQYATLDLTGGTNAAVGANANVLTGTYTGSGAGTVLLGSGVSNVGAAGATFDFPAGLFQWDGGNINLGGNILTNAGSMTLANSQDIDVISQRPGLVNQGGTLINDGSIVGSGAGSLVLVDSVQFDNQTGGKYVIGANNGIKLGPYPAVGVNSASLLNAGLLEKTSGTGVSTITTGFSNQGGTIKVDTGTISLATAGGTSTGGTFTVAQAATLDLTGGTDVDVGANANVLTGTFTGSGGGTILLGSGLLCVGTAGATFDFPAGLFQWDGGGINLAGNTLTNAGSMTLANPQGVDVISHRPGLVNQGGTLANGGSILASGAGSLVLVDSVQFDNQAGGQYVFAGDQGIELGPYPPVGVNNASLQNSGILKKSSGAGVSTITTGFNNQGGTIEVDTGTINLATTGGVSTGGTFNVAQGATLDLIAGQTVTYSGTFSGSGAGTVLFSSGTIEVGVGGVTFDFPGNLFQWTGGAIELTGGDATNNGTINLSGSAQTQIYADGTLYDYGTIVQSGTGDFGLHSDNVTPTTLMIEPGGSYVIESDAGINNLFNTNVIDNAGTIRKTAGAATSTLTVQGQFINTGVIEADSGSLSLAGTVAQVSGGALTGGTWNALNGSSLVFPVGTSITSNQANLTLAGAGATIAAISGLAANSGGLSVTDEATLTTSGNLNNTGSLTIGVGSTLTMNGNYTQGTSASLNIGIGNSPPGNEYGQLDITGSAVLAGSVNASIANGFTPTAGDSFPIVTYASETGGASVSFTGLTSGGQSVFQPVVGPTSIVLTTASSLANLVVQPFSEPANAVAGQNLTVTYQAKNQSSTAATGTWTDSVYLSTQTTLNSSSILLGRVQQTGVAANGQYSKTLTASVPGLLPTNYYVIVLADSQGLVPELNRASTELASTNPVQVTLPTLTPGSPISGTVSSGQSLYYQLTLSAGQNVAISAGFATLHGGELYVGYQSIPTTSANLTSSTSPTQTTQQVIIPDTQAGTYFILVQGDTGSSSGQPFTLSAKSLPLQVTSVGPNQAGNAGTTTLTIEGAEFTAGTTVSLVPHGGGSAIASTAVNFQSGTTLFAQFNLAGASAGSYDVVVISGGQTVTDPSSFTVKSNVTPGNVTYNLSVPSISRPGRVAYLSLTYSNDGGSDALAPLFVVGVTSGNATIGLPGETSFTGSSVQILGIENTGPAGTLPPGFQGTLLIPYESTTLVAGASIQFSLQVLTGGTTPMNWSSLEASLQPLYIPNAAWPAVFANLTAEFGSTTASYLTYLDSDATYLSQLGEYTDDVQRLFGFAINTANDALTTGSIDSVTDASFPVPGSIPLEFDRQFSASISGRDTMGPFGLGWTDNWQITSSADTAGNVTISDDGSLLYFAKNSDGTYTDSPGEYGTLTLTSGAYQYVATDGTIIAFNANGSLAYEQDTNANRITAGYNASGELTSLTASNGSAITIAYNAQGLISSITEPGSQTTTYGYDSSGQHLLTFTDVFGATTYAYAAGPSAADQNALTSLTFADGTGLEWSYDAQGRIASTGRLNGTGPEAEVETYAYPAPGEFTITNGDGDTTDTLNDDRGNIGETIDALGNITRFAYDSNDNLTKVVAADGTTTTYSFDANGNMTSETDALGYTIQFTHNQLGEPLTFLNQEGYETSYAYDGKGNLLETTNPDGTIQSYVYNTLGEVTSSTDPDGHAIGYGYNTNGQLTTENLPGGTSNSYTFDGHGNMLTAVGPGGDWTFAYNSANLPTSIVEPFGTLTVQYGIDGNLTRMVDQTGFTTNYGYDAVGRLSELTDGTGDLIESYSYDLAGNVISETKGNGTSTAYQYNADGETTKITNLAPGGSINSQMMYTYNAVGEVISMTTGGVTTAYAYDADGELTSASSPGGAILYAYDPDGNRTSVTDNGVVTNYVSNDVNEYTSTTTNGVTTSSQYDANGNLIAATTGGQTTSYTFNALNQLTGVSGPNGTFSYVYDPLGYQISSTVNGQTTHNLIDPFGLGNVAAQFDSSGNVVAQYTYGLGLVSQVTAGGAAYYYDYNLQGSTAGITNSAGVYVNQYSYDPFGEVTTVSAGITNPFTFVGQDGVSSDGNGLTYMRARYFDARTGQFVSNDPFGLGGSDLNIRRYVANDPIIGIDPLGLYNVLGQTSDGTGGVAIPDFGKGFGPEFWKDVVDANIYNYNQINNQMQKVVDQTNKDISPPQNPNNSGSGGNGSTINQPPHDPNDLLGPSGYGSAGFLTPAGTFGYTIEFSNEKTAEVPADNVVVTEQLSPNLNWSTLQLGTIGFGSYVVNVPAGLTSYSTRVDATATLGVYVEIDASLNLGTGLLTITFTSLDPNTLDTPSNPLEGFLPPDTAPPNGEGYINYTIQPKTGLATGTPLTAQASIVFDTNAAIATPQITNTIDASPPTSSVTTLPPTTTSTSFSVAWSGSDGAGSGIASFNVYVSDNGGGFTLWQADTTKTSATYTGQVGQTYRFYSVATDNLGLIQPTPATPQATISVINTPTPTPTPPPPPLVTVESVKVETIKVGKGKKAKKETVLVVQLSGAVNAGAADNASAYQFAAVTKVPAKGKGKNRKPATIKLGARMPPASAVYSPSNNTVTLTPRGKLTATKPEELIVNGSFLTDTLGREIDGNDDGQPGGDYIATISGSRATAGGVSLVRTQQQPSTVADVIDHLLARGELTRSGRP